MTIRVVQVHDAAIDEYMATILLTTMEEVVLDGVVIVNADCIYGPAMDAAWKIQQAGEHARAIPLYTNALAVGFLMADQRASVLSNRCWAYNATAALATASNLDFHVLAHHAPYRTNSFTPSSGVTSPSPVPTRNAIQVANGW